MAIPLLERLDLQDKDITADAFSPSANSPSYLVKRQAHYHFTVKANPAHAA